jgi:uncharacterized protein (DUF433 family)
MLAKRQLMARNQPIFPVALNWTRGGQGERTGVVAVAQISTFSEGLYTPDQAARLARLTPQTVRRWFDGVGGHEPAAIRRLPKEDAGLLGFVDLVQAMAIRAIRLDRKLSLQKIRETINAAKELGVEYPFARKHQTFLFADDVVIKLADNRLIQVTGRYKMQECIRPVLEVFMDDLCFDADTGLANEYRPLKDDGHYISISPSRKYGAPVVMPQGYTVSSLVNAAQAEGSPADAASAFNVPESAVRLALKYDDFLLGRAA